MKLWPRAHRRVPPVLQLELADCGPACLAMVLGYHGRHATLDEVRARFDSGRDGSSAHDILVAAQKFGLEGQAVRLDMVDFDALPPGSVLHWQMAHFVVLERRHRNGADIVDPNLGQRFVPTEELERSFTGVALLFEPTENFEKGSRRPSPLMEYLRRVAMKKALLGQTVVTSVLLQLLAMLLPLGMALVVDGIVPRADRSLLHVMMLGIGVVAVYAFFTSYVRAHLLLALRTRLDMEMTTAFVDHLLRLPFTFFQRRQTGDLVMRLNSNTTIRELLTSGVMSGFLDGLLVVGYLVVILITDWRLGLVVMGLGALRVFVYLASRHRFRVLTGESLQAVAEASNYQVQMLEGIESLKSAGAEERAQQLWSDLFVRVLNVSIQRGRLSAVVDSLLHTLELASPLLVLALGAAFVLDGHMSLGTMLAVAALASAFLTPLGNLVSTLLQMQQLWSTIERVEDVLCHEREQREGRPAAPSLKGALSLRGLCFRYAESSPWAVNRVDLDVEPGQQVAIVGPSGSGKSTLARLLAALYVPQRGEILFDGAPLTDCDLPSLRRQLGFVPQHPFLFGATIRSNIAMADPSAELAEVEAAAKLADIHAEIDQLPLGYETPLASTGSNLSGGQRQRVALARAMLQRPPILVLDEATSHLDTRSEARVYAHLRQLDATRIVIAHRLSTIVDSDLIVVMDQGCVVERGTHAELLAAKGLYAQLIGADREAADGPNPGA